MEITADTTHGELVAEERVLARKIRSYETGVVVPVSSSAVREQRRVYRSFNRIQDELAARGLR